MVKRLALAERVIRLCEEQIGIGVRGDDLAKAAEILSQAGLKFEVEGDGFIVGSEGAAQDAQRMLKARGISPVYVRPIQAESSPEEKSKPKLYWSERLKKYVTIPESVGDLKEGDIISFSEAGFSHEAKILRVESDDKFFVEVISDGEMYGTGDQIKITTDQIDQG